MESVKTASDAFTCWRATAPAPVVLRGFLLELEVLWELERWELEVRLSSAERLHLEADDGAEEEEIEGPGPECPGGGGGGGAEAESSLSPWEPDMPADGAAGSSDVSAAAPRTCVEGRNA